MVIAQKYDVDEGLKTGIESVRVNIYLKPRYAASAAVHALTSQAEESNVRFWKRSVAIFAGIVLVGLLAACGTAAKPTPTPTEAAQEAAPVPTPSQVVSVVPTVAPATTSGAAPTTPLGQRPEYGGTITIASPYSEKQGDPYSVVGFGQGNFQFGWMPYNSLVQAKLPYDPSKGIEIEPYLATEWSKSEDGSKWTFKLRDGVTWHDGEIFNADDVLATVQRLLDPEVLISVRDVAMRQIFVGAKKIDDRTVVLDTGSPNSEAFAWISGFNFVMVPEHIIKGDPASKDPDVRWRFMGLSAKETGKLPVGTGPFIFKKFAPEDEFVLERNPNYWKRDEFGNKLPYIDRWVYRLIPDGTRLLANFVAGNLTYTVGVGAGMRKADAESLCKSSRDPGCYVLSWPSGFAWALENTETVPAFKDTRVAAAARYAIDMDEIFRRAYGKGQGFMWMDRGRFPNAALTVKEQYERLPWSDPNLRQEYRQKAKDLLTQAGYPDGFDLPYPIFGSACSGNFLDQYTRLTEHLYTVGIRGSLDCRSNLIKSSERQAGRYGFDTNGNPIYLVDPGLGLQSAALLDSLGLAISPARYEGLLELDRRYRATVKIVDEAKRNESYKEMERFMANPGLTRFPQGYSDGHISIRGCMKNFNPGFAFDPRTWGHERTWLTQECRQTS